MQAEKLILTKAHKKQSGGDYWYSRPGSIRYTQAEMLELIKKGTELEFSNGDEAKELLALLCLADIGVTSNTKIDRNKQGCTKQLNRIIRAGGFCAYIETLENK